MDLLFDRFPVFEVNQVLTSGHLNDIFDYLDQQTRLTRANLIGIGIVCGLEIKLDTAAGTAILLSKGCGVTSEGYLIVEPEDLRLVAYRAYTIPSDLDYPPFKNADTKAQYPLWELFAAGEPNTTPLSTPAGFLDDKAVVLFLELKKQGLRNCSPNNCDDKGAEVTATVRRLLIATADLDKIIAAAHVLGSGLTTSDIDAALSAKLNLADLRVPRFDVLNSGPVTSNDVYAGFLNVFRTGKLAQATADALSAAYTAFKPVLQAAYPVNPFANFSAPFGFLDSAPASTAEVRFLQYYVDLFEDVLRAYDEFRWVGVELICACCPPDDIFPRHLMLGLLHPEKASEPGRYRQVFLPSPACGCCAAETKTLLELFARLVEMAARFTNAPGLPKPDTEARIDPQIRITPSVLGDKPLAAKAIPYYYRQDGAPPLYRLWNDEKTRRNRANQNLSYRYDEYAPPARAFVSDPLRYDLEPYDFLRIEGHLGKDYQRVLTTLLLLKSQYRLPIDIIALRTGAYDDTQPVDLTKEAARFQDLEVLYETLKEELLSSLAEGAMDLYDLPVANSTLPVGTPKLPLLEKYAPYYRYPAGSVGAVYEEHLQSFQAIPYIDVDPTLVSDPKFVNQVLTVYCILFHGVTDLPPANYPHVVSIFYFSKLAEVLPAMLDALAYADFEHKYQGLLALVRYFRSQAIENVPADLKSFVPQEELIDQFDQVLFNCKLDPIKAVHDEYARRVSVLKKRQFLSNFLQQHPGIQHKAGVPLGGTFIVVYHKEPFLPLGVRGTAIANAALFAKAFAKAAPTAEQPVAPAIGRAAAAGPTPAMAARRIGVARMAAAMAEANVKSLALTDAISRISSNRVLAQNPDVSLVIGSLTGRIPIFDGGEPPRGLDDQAAKIITAAVNELADGTVIADFFLPYQISCDCPGIEFVLPKSVPSFSLKADCTSADGIASVAIEVKGGVPPYDIAVDQTGYQAMGKTLSLQAGAHSVRIRDTDGTESDPQSITIPNPIGFGAPEFKCQDGKFTATVTITGGTPPYTVNGKPIAGSSFTTDPVASGASVSVEVMDSVQCSGKTAFTHTCPPPCTLPCAGISLRRGYRFWLADPDPNRPYTGFKLDDLSFSVETSPGKPVDLSAKIRPVIQAQAADLTVANFAKLVGSWVAQINKIVLTEPTLNQDGKVSWLTLAYEPAGPGRLGTLWIEYFQCLSFKIQMASTITRSGPSESLRLAYAPEGTTVQLNDKTAQVPAFGGVKIDKCNPSTPAENLCPAAPPFTLKIAKTGQTGATVRLEVTADTPNAADLQFLWEVQDANPPMGNGAAFSTTFAAIDNKPRLVTVTAFTKAGCTVTQSTLIQISAG